VCTVVQLSALLFWVVALHRLATSKTFWDSL